MVSGLTTENADDGAVASDGVVAHLARADGDIGPICDADCELPADGTSTVVTVDLVTAADVEGPVVPVAAIGVDDAGHTYVVEAGSSDRTLVTVLVEADGRAVVSGIAAGDRVVALVPG